MNIIGIYKFLSDFNDAKKWKIRYNICMLLNGLADWKYTLGRGVSVAAAMNALKGHN